ncbi:MAG: AAA family ATPase [Armatimonadota bacterium]|nr:AAA family ATPase [Armatimonadota bacterium]
MEECGRFFDAMYGRLEKGESIEVRVFPTEGARAAPGSAGQAGRWFYPGVYSAIRQAQRMRKRCDVYFGVATRDGKGGEEANLARIPCAWADLDAKPGLESPEARMKRARLQPSAVVSSGKGLHLYWFLDTPVPASEMKRVEEINKAIARALDGDTAHDATRVLRVPGTYNHKYRRPLDVTLATLAPRRRYAVEEMEEVFRDGPENLPPTPSQREGESSESSEPSESESAARLEFCTVGTLAARRVTEAEFVVEGLVPLRGVTLMTGEGGIGKSYLLMDMAMSVAGGQPFLDTFTCRQGPVCIIDLENDENSIARRTQKLLRARGVSDLPTHIARKGGPAEAELAIDKEPSLKALTEGLEAVRPIALIIDPLTAAHSKDENDNMAMRSVIRTLSRLAQEFEMAVIVAHHPRKRGQNNDAGQMIRGASDLRNAVDSHIFLRRIDDSRLLVEHDKSRHAPELEKFQVEMVDGDDGESIRFNHLGPAPDAAVKSTEARAFVQGVLEDGPRRRKEILALAQADGLHFRVMENALTALTEEGLILRPERGLYQRADSATDSTFHTPPI